jgi:uncharacterized protein (TIGR03118 family)
MRSVLLRTFLACAATVSTALALPIDFNLTTLATNATDSQLINPWGIAASASSPLWIGSNGSGVSEIYTAAGVKNALVVTIPGDGSVTGVAFNGTSDFHADNFLFVSEDGTVSGWRSALGTAAETLEAANASDVYKGLTLDTAGGFNYALLANFRAGTVDVLKGNAADPNLAGNFTDPTIPAGYAPFDVQNLNGVIYVTYAEQDALKHDEVDGSGLGYVDAFDLNGNLISRLVGNGALNAPWGLAIAPAGFGDLGGDLLVGNFGDGTINAYNATTGVFQETLHNTSGNPITIDGLWALHFGSGSANGGSTNSLFVTAGPNGESGGLFARIDPVPEPGTWLFAGLGLVTVIARRRTISPD